MSILTDIIKERSNWPEKPKYASTRHRNIILFAEYALLIEAIFLVYAWRDSLPILLKHLGL